MRALLQTIWRFLFYKLTHAGEEKWRTLAICLILSGTLWFLRQMNKTYTTGMKVRLAFEYDPGRFAPQDPLPDAIWLNVTARGWPLAIAAYSPSRPRLVVRPALAGGFWMADSHKVRRYLQPRMPGVHINALQDPAEPYRFDSLVSREVPITVTLPGGRQAQGQVCFKGWAARLLRLPRARRLQEASAGERLTIPLSRLYPSKWADCFCKDEVELRIEN